MILNEIEYPILVTNDINKRWFHRTSGLKGIIYRSSEGTIFYSEKRKLPDLLLRNVSFQHVPRERIGNAVINQLKREGKNRLFVEYDIPLDIYNQINDDSISIISQKGLIEGLREIKNDWEILQLSEAVRVATRAFNKILKVLRPGMTELEVASELERYMRLEGCEEINKTIVASGINSAIPHNWPTNKYLEKGDFVTMDFGCSINGYHSDMTRTVVIGKSTDVQKEIYHIVLDAYKASRNALKSGVESWEIDKVARDIIDLSQYKGRFLHNLGHGIGLEIHEGTGLSKGDTRKLLTGMVVSIEPGIYIEGFGGVRIEDIAIVEQNGCRVLGDPPCDLIEL